MDKAALMEQLSKMQKTETAAPPPAVEKKCFDDLKEYIDLTKSAVLNAADPQMLQAVLCGAEGEAPVMKSDCDEQLLFTISFKQPVRLQSIAMSAPSAGPRAVKLFANRDNMSFDDASDVTPTQGIMVGGPAPTQLQFVKFQNVNFLSVFIEDNNDDDEVTCLQRLTLVGDAMHKTNMNDLKKGG